MNTILIKFLFILLLIPCELFSSDNDTAANNSLRVSLGAGPSFAINKLSKKQLSDVNFYANFRIMWLPDKKLNLGIEAAYLNLIQDKTDNVITDYGVTNYYAKLYAYPVNLLLSIEIGDFNLSGGAGFSLTYSKIQAFGETIFSSVITGNYTYGLSYNLNALKYFPAQIELKGYFIPTVNKYAVTLMLSAGYDLLTW